MALLLQTSAVRIFDRADGSVFGAGFLADTDIVLTCAACALQAPWALLQPRPVAQSGRSF